MNQDDGKASRVPGSAVIALAIVAAATILAWSGGDDPPRYELVATGDAVVRMDNDSGAMIACNLQRCVQIRAPDRAIATGSLKGMLPGGKGAIEENETTR